MRCLLLAHDHFLDGKAKTAEALIRYGSQQILAVIDQAVGTSGATADRVLGPSGQGIPVLPTIEHGLELEPEALVIGVAPVGGQLPPAWRGDVQAALDQGVHVVSGMHEFLGEDEELVSRGAKTGATLTDVRKPPEEQPIYTGEVLDLPCTIVLTVGTDCSIGKMTTTMELHRALNERGTKTAFVATGQTGCMLGPDSGVVVDALQADFLAGWAERLVIDAYEATEADVILVEGQGSITHPAYAAVTLGLLHGTSPHACILCHDGVRREKTTRFHRGRTFPVWPPEREWALLHEAASALRTPQLAGLSIMNPPTETEPLSRALGGVPVVDVLGQGPGRLAEAVEALL